MINHKDSETSDMSDEIKNALRLARAFGGMAYEANNVASGMSNGGALQQRSGYQMGGMPMPPTPNSMGMMQGQPMNNQPGNPMNSFGQQTQNGIDGDPIRDMGYTSPPPFATLDNNLPPPQPVQAPVPSSYNPLMSNTPPAPMADGGVVSDHEIQELLDFPLGRYAEGGAVEEALEKTHGEHAIPFHQAIARSGYAEGGHVSDAEIQELLDFPLGRHGYATDGAVEADVAFAPDDKPDYERASQFEQQELKGSAPQYDPENGINTAKEVGRAIANMTTPGAIADAAGYLGGPSALENWRRGNRGEAALQVAGAIPFVGPLAKLGAGAHLAMSMIPKARAVEDAVALAKAEPKLRVYHGSPHQFDEFDTSKIGTGEGAQAYGHGLYFAENEDVAQQYRDSLSQRAHDKKTTIDNDVYMNGEKIHPSHHDFLTISGIADNGFDKQMSDAISRLEQRRSAGMSEDSPLVRAGQNVINRLDKYKDAKIHRNLVVNEPEFDPGHMYEVGIHAEPEHFLDWDKSLSDQPHVVEMLKRIGAINDDGSLSFMYKETPQRGGEMYERLTSPLASKITQGRGQSAASDTLKKAGIPGIKYLDQGSRGAGEGSRNYVVFDPQHLEILRRYAKGGDVEDALNLARKKHG
jgi:hypothetical protein